MICHSCRIQLEKFYTFKKKCESSDLKLRRHVKLIQEKICKETENGENGKILNVNDVLADLMNDDTSEEPNQEEPSSEQDIVGARVAYLQNDMDQQDENDPESITLPIEHEDSMTKEACTLKTLNLKKELEDQDEEMMDEVQHAELYLLPDDGHGHEQDQELEEETLLEQDQHCLSDENDFTAIAEAVKGTLSTLPGFNVNGQLQIQLDSKPGKATQVQVTTEDGSVVIMELMTTDDIPEPAMSQEQDEDGELKVFQCPDCSKAFSRRIQLRRHASVHMQQRGFSCGICEKWFPTRSALIRHERIHTGERPFQCEVCHKSFAQKEILYRHLMTHTGQKPYNCPHCPKGFTQKEPLRIHMRTHTNPNPTDIQLHHCTLCPKVFCHASGLSRHLVTHTGKTFKCRDCDKAFTDKSSLRRHHKQTNHQP